MNWRNLINNQPIAEVSLVAVLLTIVTSSPMAIAQISCSPIHNRTAPVEMAWRAASTQPAQSGAISQTNKNRETMIKSTVDFQENFILNYVGDYGRGDIPPMSFFAAEHKGLKMKTIVQSDGLNSKITKYLVSGLGPSGVLKGTLLLPVSGHGGNAKAKTWAVTDLYDVRLDGTRSSSVPQNTPFNLYSEAAGNEVSLVRNVKSLDLVTKQEIEIPLKANDNVLVLYYRHGSAGPAGYVEGRVIEFHWDGT